MPGVLKKEQVKTGSARMLAPAPVVPSIRPTAAPFGPAEPSRVAGGPQARVVEQNGQSVLIEVICECGQKIYLNCECG